ncbi:Zinc finger C2H2-type,SET domain [Cinara cedri]|uniref:Zinc finger C2H2-type,SET domain n=1 Tax=Cinara cedri TaxID=506608 RepID=A0A5E4MNJ7_9HEMI|nr:Zinc finger C2H2-type,SET domain [Cinara cedri]
MPNKNPFLKTGKRKRRNRKKTENTTKPDDKPFCPRLMVRYDQSENSTIGYKVIWVCKMCMKCILHEDAVLTHLQRCKIQFKNRTTFYEPIKSAEVKNTRYVCRLCDGVFSRKVTLLKHIEKHENNSDSELYESESEFVAPTKRHKPNASLPISLGGHDQKASASSVDHNQIAETPVPKRKAKAKTSQSVSTEGHNIKSTSASSLDVNTLENRSAAILCMADDVATSSVLDFSLGFLTHKTHIKQIPPLTSKELEILSTQKLMYTNALSASSKFKFKKCNRYPNDCGTGAKVVAKSRIHRDEILRDLRGRLCTVNESFIKSSGIDSFLVQSTRAKNNKSEQLWLGPATYINHDCNSNSKIYSINNDFACVKATRVIEPKEEITINYGDNFFSSDECYCATCEKNCRGAFSIHQQSSTELSCHT